MLETDEFKEEKVLATILSITTRSIILETLEEVDVMSIVLHLMLNHFWFVRNEL